MKKKEERLIYAKFIKNKEFNTFGSFRISSDLKEAKAFISSGKQKGKGDDKPTTDGSGKSNEAAKPAAGNDVKSGQAEEKPEQTAEEQRSTDFDKLANEFVLAIDSFEQTVPVLLTIMPILGALQIDRSLYKYFSDYARRIEKEEDSELFQIAVEHFERIERLVFEARAFRSGRANLPNIMLLGLISAYDAFFSQLLKMIFLTKPEIISASERNITFKDLVAAGSLDAARDMIMEKEIESIMRNSHHD